MADPLSITMDVAHVGFSFAEHYYALMCMTPKYARPFYDDFGEYQTVYEDATPGTQLEVKKVLLRPMSASKLIVNSIISVLYDGSLDRLLVHATGQWFTHVFVAENGR
ncbi:Hypothetical protein CINCED_3A001344 [Cinara cedri]|uniref:Uncharacterized protein n=1 Tax=Cinara cedri TaxID=506608 RepID=A0A5E4MD11_9HEMI|nr:Hypothetical protein CINCED_3A001344 [Cinara cedri]